MGESARQITEKVKDNSGRDHTLHVLKHSIEKSHKNVNTKRKQKIAEALWMKDLRSTLNTQEKSIQIKLFN